MGCWGLLLRITGLGKVNINSMKGELYTSKENRTKQNFTPLPEELEKRRKGYLENLRDEIQAFHHEFLTREGWEERKTVRKRLHELANGKKNGKGRLKHTTEASPPHPPFTLKNWLKEIKSAIKGEWPDTKKT